MSTTPHPKVQALLEQCKRNGVPVGRLDARPRHYAEARFVSRNWDGDASFGFVYHNWYIVEREADPECFEHYRKKLEGVTAFAHQWWLPGNPKVTWPAGYDPVARPVLALIGGLV